MEATERLILPELDTCKASIFNCFQLFIIMMGKTSWLQGNQYREVNPEGCNLVLGTGITCSQKFNWKYISLARAPTRKKMSRCPLKGTGLVIFRFPDAAFQYFQQPGGTRVSKRLFQIKYAGVYKWPPNYLNWALILQNRCAFNSTIKW